MIPYGRQLVEDDDIAAVAAVLRSDWLTGGPAIDDFERALCAQTGAAARGRVRERHRRAARARSPWPGSDPATGC